MTAVLILVLAWVIYAVVHTLLASEPVKGFVGGRFPSLAPAYRLLFNLFALLALIPVAIAHLNAGSAPIWQWSGAWAWVANGLAMLAVISFLISTRYYDGGEFLGTRQWQERRRRVQDEDGFTLSPFHRHVRHPWYSFGLVIIWTRDMDAAMLTSALMISLYFWIGSLFEERKLVKLYGDVYRTYRQRVPGLIPVPGHHLSTTEADALINGSPR